MKKLSFKEVLLLILVAAVITGAVTFSLKSIFDKPEKTPESSQGASLGGYGSGTVKDDVAPVQDDASESVQEEPAESTSVPSSMSESTPEPTPSLSFGIDNLQSILGDASWITPEIFSNPALILDSEQAMQALRDRGMTDEQIYDAVNEWLAAKEEAPVSP